MRASKGQARLYLLQQLHPGNPFYQYAHRYDLTGPMDELLLGQSFLRVVDRHELLRSNFVHDEDEVLLQVSPPGDFDLARAYLEDVAQTEQEAEALRLESEFVQSPFDLEEDYLLRGLLIRFSPTKHRLLLSIHHIIGDRGSLQLLEEEVFGQYTKLIAGQEDTIPPLSIQFADFAYREATREVPEQHYAYWRKQLAGELPLSALPHDFERPPAPSYRGALLEASVSPAVSSGIQALARGHNTTPNVVFLSALNAFLYRYTGQEDVLIGSPVSIRDHREIEQLIGFLNETVVLRNGVTGQQSFNELIAATRTSMEAALENKDVPFEWLISELQPERRGGVNPFFQTMFVYNADAGERTLPEGLSLDDAYIDLGTAKFDLTLFATNRAEGFKIGFEYASDLFREETVQTMLDHFGILLNNLVSTPEADIATRELLRSVDKELLLKAWNPTFPTEEEAEAPSLLTELFVRNAIANPKTIGVTSGAEALSQGEILARSTRLAEQLLEAGLQAGTAVGLYCGRTPDLLVGILGILRAGGAYVPLDPEYPQERIDFILDDAGAKILVHAPGLSPPLAAEVISLAIPEEGLSASKVSLPNIDRQQNAYLIYTSGSTGKPKGIAITHDNLARSTDARFRFYDRQPGAFLLLSSFAFDSSVAGIFWSVASGGKLVLSARRAEQDPAGLGRLIRSEGVTHTLMLPSLYQLLLEFATPADLSSLNIVMVAGEACPTALVERHFKTLAGTQLVNEYGPTEGTVWSTAHRLQAKDAHEGVPIGRPVYGMGHYVLDANQQLLPPGLAGELCLSGRQLAAGYHGRADLTAESFKPSPFVAGERLYRTGDLVRYRPNGLLDFLGRYDQQVKIRGHRIELTEISKALDRSPAVRESVVVALAQGEELRVVAYFQPEDEVKTGIQAELIGRLREQLPEYMVPSLLVALSNFPRLPNGKIDRKALPEPEWKSQDDAQEYTAPEGALEEQLAELWRKTLKLDAVGRHDNFFSIGGDSLKSIRIIAGAAKAGISIAPHHLFNHQTVAELAAALASKEQNTASGVRAYEAAVLLRKGGDKPPLFCLHSGGGHVFFYQQLAQSLNGSRSIYALQPKGLSGETNLPASMQEMAADYIAAIKDIQPRGPYLLLGTCFSNALAVEMATQLTARGDKMLPLVIVDSGTGTFMRPDADLDTGNKITNLIRLIRRGRWDKIARRLRVRGILGYRKVASQLDEQRRNLYGTIGALNEIYAAYEWPSYPGKVLFIRSTEFANRRDKDNHVSRWQALVDEVDVYVVEGEHLTMFQEPAVTGLAEKIDERLP